MAKPNEIKSAENKGMLLVDLGKKSRKKIKRLRKGSGALVDEVQHCVDDLRAEGKMPDSGQPLVIVVREKRPRFLW